MKRFRPRPAESLGIIVHYTCTNRCAHCLYACHPAIEERVEQDDLDRIADSIARACPSAPVHIGGGEPLWDVERTAYLLRRLHRNGTLVEYVETNGFWIRSEQPRQRLETIKAAGCPCVLLSISPFHNEFLSMKDSLRAYRAIVRVFGPRGIFPWHPAYYRFLRRVAPERTVPFQEYIRHFTAQEIDIQLRGIIYLHPAGRAAATFARLMQRRPPEAYRDKNCLPELSSPVHAHVDPMGNYLTGFCSGLRIGEATAYDLRRLYEDGIHLEGHPLLEMLVSGRLGDLLRFSLDLGFDPDPLGYISPCHLCGHIRTWLFLRSGSKSEYPELGPAFFYEEMAASFSV